MKVAAVVLNYNSSADCKICIDYLKKQVDVELEIVVVDNASSPEERKKLSQFVWKRVVHSFKITTIEVIMQVIT